MKKVEADHCQEYGDVNETSGASEVASLGEISKILQELDLSVGELACHNSNSVSLPDPDSSTLEMALRVLAQDGLNDDSFLEDAEARDLDAILKAVDELGSELDEDGLSVENRGSNTLDDASCCLTYNTTTSDSECKLESKPSDAHQEPDDPTAGSPPVPAPETRTQLQQTSPELQGEGTQRQEDVQISESTEAFERIEARVAEDDRSLFDVGAEVERLHKAYLEKEADVKHLNATVEKLISALRQEKHARLALEARDREQAETREQLLSLKEEYLKLNREFKISRILNPEAKVKEEVQKLRNEAAQQDRLIAGFQKENAKLYEELNSVKETFKKSLVGWEKEKNEFVAGMAQLREKMMLKGFLPASGDGEGENVRVLKELIASDRENVARLRHLEESFMAACAELEVKNKALEAARNELEKLRSAELAERARTEDGRVKCLEKQVEVLKQKVETEGPGKSLNDAIFSETQALRSALDELKSSMIAENDDARDKLRRLTETLNEERTKSEAIKTMYEGRIMSLASEVTRLREKEAEPRRNVATASTSTSAGPKQHKILPATPVAPPDAVEWAAEKRDLEAKVRVLELDRQKLLVALSSIRRGMEESRGMSRAAAADAKDETFVAPPSVEKKLAAGLSSYIHHLEMKRLKDEAAMKELHESTVKRITNEFKVREKGLEDELNKCKVQLSIQNDVLQQLRAAHLANGTTPGSSSSFNKLKREKADLVEELTRVRAEGDEEISRLRRENETLKMVLNPNQEVGLRLCARVEELERLYKRKANQFDNLWRRLNAMTSSSPEAAAATSGIHMELRKIFDSSSAIFRDGGDGDGDDEENFGSQVVVDDGFDDDDGGGSGNGLDGKDSLAANAGSARFPPTAEVGVGVNFDSSGGNTNSISNLGSNRSQRPLNGQQNPSRREVTESLANHASKTVANSSACGVGGRRRKKAT